MPKIEINEIDLTQASGTVGTDIPFIPGFANAVYEYSPFTGVINQDTDYYVVDTAAAEGYRLAESQEKSNIRIQKYTKGSESLTVFNKPVLCTSISMFEQNFGRYPVMFTTSYTDYNINTNDVDKSYIMAKELLSQGMPVYYYAIPYEGASRVETTSTLVISNLTCGDFTFDKNASGKFVIDFANTLQGNQTITINFKTPLKLGDKIEYEINFNESQITLPTTIVSNGTIVSTTPLSSITVTVACEVDRANKFEIPTFNKVTSNTITVDAMATFYEKILALYSSEELLDKGEYSFKYLTLGGYPSMFSGSTIHSSMVQLCANRGDCVAILESKDDASQSLNPTGSSYFASLQSDGTLNSYGEYATTFFPWGEYSLAKSYKRPTTGEIKLKDVTKYILPACFGYLLDLAKNIKTTPNWLAMAGTTRGIVPNLNYLHLDSRLSNLIADDYQPTKGTDNHKRAVNAITEIKPYGLTIWGNRTLKTIMEEGLEATNFLNTRNMISDIKKVLYRAAKSQLFEQNSDILWLNFKGQVSPFLEQLKNGNGISDYKLIKLDTHYTGGSLGKEEFACAVKIFPLYAVESFEITVVISDNDVSVG